MEGDRESKSFPLPSSITIHQVPTEHKIIPVNFGARIGNFQEIIEVAFWKSKPIYNNLD